MILEIEGNLPDLRIYGVEHIVRHKNFYEIDIFNENIANTIQNVLFQNRVKIINFSLQYKSLHEIFLEMAGD